MKNRLEYKYLVPVHCMDELRRDLLKYMEYDEYAASRPDNEYTVHSVYYDSFNYKCYYEKLDGIHTRKKFRIRGYNRQEDESNIFFEIKRKYDNFISKDRAGTSYENVRKALTSAHSKPYFSLEHQSDFKNFYFYYCSRKLEPKVLVVYDREPFECKFGSKLRITFDKNLRSRMVADIGELFSEEGLIKPFKKEFIFEIKFYQVLPQWINRMLVKYDLTRTAVSKYTSSIDAQKKSTVTSNKFTRKEFTIG